MIIIYNLTAVCTFEMATGALALTIVASSIVAAVFHGLTHLFSNATSVLVAFQRVVFDEIVKILARGFIVVGRNEMA